jgi:hypothetical protein
MCLSGDANELGETEWRLVREAVAFYGEVAPVIRDGTFRCVRSTGASWQHLQGHQIVTVLSREGRQLLVVWHRFASRSEQMEFMLPGSGTWRLARDWGQHGGRVLLRQNQIVWTDCAEWTGGVLLLDRE